MELLAILAQTADTAQKATETTATLVPIDDIWKQITSLSFLEALTFISFGTVCLLYGWRLFRTLVVMCFGLVGMFAGALLANEISGSDNQIIGGLIGFAILAVLSLPLMKAAISLLGAAAGGILTAGLWYAFELPEQYIWAGGLVGIVAGGMIAFIALKWAVMLFSCLGGSCLLIIGLLALFYLWPDTSDQVQQLVYDKNWFLPTALIVPTVIGFILQHKFIKRSAEWKI